jgi:hypothetical protein
MTTRRDNQRELIKRSIHIPIDESNFSSYQDIKDKIKPFDLIAFRGGDVISDLITKMEENNVGLGAFSHVGMVVTADILPYYIVDNKRVVLSPNHLYVFESTFSYNIPGITDGPHDVITGKGKFGVQLRDLEEVIPRYITNQKTKVAWCKLLNNPFINIKNEPHDDFEIRQQKIQEMFQKFFQDYEGRLYEIDIDDLFAAMFPTLRIIRKFKDNIFKSLFKVLNLFGLSKDSNIIGPAGWQFCSELVANAYKLIGVIPESFDPRDVLPVDFFGYDEDGLPALVDSPVFIRDWDIPGESSIHYNNDKSHIHNN